MQNIYAIDFETTGLDPKTCEPVEVALFSPEMPFSWLINPLIPIPAETSAIHHITDTDVLYAQTWKDVRSALAQHLTVPSGQKLPILIAHNIGFDKDILLRPFPGEVAFPPVLWICTYKCSLRLWPGAPSHKCEVLRYWLKLGDNLGRLHNQQPHSALHDCKVTYALFLEMLKRATLEQLIEWSDLPAQLPKMPMGKYFGQAWRDIPQHYLKWCTQQKDMREDVKHCAKSELERRHHHAT